ncbi:hypothetical protein LshimejAT787_0302130 [Lyophyllum shimeji]|uniref:Uncharacterized protein n=1 Tax=Lyophyllum shimeji TaxID=47721 RepID=A0A9P3PH16_LYOSH|nr:hypothetical protein LshimejAT787_0302130 [Lyophyllum shimeji]
MASQERSRIHFPVDNASPSRPIHRSADATLRVSPVPSRTSPVRRSLTPGAQNASASSRRRVRSVATPGNVFLDSQPSRRQHTTSLLTPPRGLNSLAGRAFETVEEDNVSLGIFSDEYDLAHEDPRILQDVQRALKLKARREARLSNKLTPPRSDFPARHQTANSSTSPSTFPTSPSPRKESMSSDLDFSPATGVSFLHPVPASLDNGMTLDWSGFDEKPDSRWRLTSTKRKGKGFLPPMATVMEQQEAAYADKIARLKSVASPQTLKKAKITEDQLGRRYNLVYGMLPSGPPLNIAKVAQWYGRQDALVRNALEKAEPFTWLKHLDRRGTNLPERPPRYLSALIIEEYIQDQTRHDSMTTIPEDSPLREISPEVPPSFANAPLASIPSRTSSNHLLGPSLAKNVHTEDGITFEPRVHSTRSSLEVDSRRSRGSSFSSLPIGFPSTAPSSPSGNRSQPREVVSGVTRRLPNEGLPAEPLHSEESDHGNKSSTRHGSAMASPDLSIKVVPVSDQSEEDATRKAGILVQLTAPAPEDVETPQPPNVRPPAPQQSRPVDRILGRRRRRVSLPPPDSALRSSEARQRQEADEEKAYEAKARLLQETTSHNHRIRQLLNRVSVGIRELETAQSNALSSLGIAHSGLPRDLIDAFGHDPAAVTGATRRFQGWRAADDIHNRLLRQRDVFQAFLSRANRDASVPKSVLNDPISSLIQSLEALEVHSQKIAGKAIEVDEALKSVQATHNAVKTNYKDTSSRTSLVYPELSYIIALEESYKDQYQQFWEFGMDTLTFLLDTVTPFWRSYGKPIGEDIRDFLIIPLYRNEFTGESKRYPITRIPSRSFRHWLGLILFFIASVTVTVLQARAAISSASHYRLQMIPYESIRWTALPFFWISIIIQWWATLVESVVVFLELGVLVWWVGWSVRIFT